MSLLKAVRTPRALRADIQALRGYAVLVVLLFHAKLTGFAGGYLGVDVFFVISGFLITRLVADGVRAGSFSFSEFYFRRAKRLLPAAYVTLLLTALAAPFFLNDPEYLDFRGQFLGALTFCANIVLWRQSGYFEGASDLKPLLHIWSLSLEEQYYFVLPALLVLTPLRRWRTLVWGGVSLSLALFVYREGSASTFYLLPTRAWELGIGSVGALAVLGDRAARLIKLAFWPALAVLLATPIAAPLIHSASLATAMACTATVLVILRQHPGGASNPAIKTLVWLGDRSYSLYLVHWPLFAFLNNSWFGLEEQLPPLSLRVALLAMSVAVAYVLFRFVEQPVHQARLERRSSILKYAGIASLLLLGVVFAAPLLNPPARDYAAIRQRNYGFAGACEFQDDFQPIPACRNSSAPETLVWGDSYAMHLIPGMTADSSYPTVVQATRSVCGPILGVAFVEQSSYDRNWAERCIRFSKSVLTYLERSTSVKRVVLASPFNQFVKPGNQLLIRRDSDGSYYTASASVQLAASELRKTISAIRALGKRVVIVGPPPYGSYDIGRCLERVERRMPVVGVASACEIDKSASLAERGGVFELMNTLSRDGDVNVLDLSRLLCAGARCRTYADGVFLYRDRGHLSVDGSIFLFKTYHLVAAIDTLAR